MVIPIIIIVGEMIMDVLQQHHEVHMLEVQMVDLEQEPQPILVLLLAEPVESLLLVQVLEQEKVLCVQ